MTRTDGLTNLTDLDLYQDHLLLRHDAGGPLTTATLATAAVAADPDISNLYTVSGGALTVAGGKTLLIPSSHTFAPDGAVTTHHLAVAGTLTLGAQTLTVNGAFTQTVGTLNAGSATLDLNGAFSQSGGTFTAPAGTMTVAGPFTHSAGTFTHNSGTVLLDGTTQTLSGATSFFHLTKTTTSAATLTFPANTTQTLAGTLTLQGAAGQLLSLRSSVSGTAWSLDPQGTRAVNFVDVQDSTNVHATPITAYDATDSLRNTNWSFKTQVTGRPYPSGSVGAPMIY